MNKENLILTLETLLIQSLNQREIVRRNRKMLETNNSKIKIDRDIFDSISEYRQEEYDQYLEMITPQITRFKKYFDLDKFSRRLLIQFPANWYEDKGLDYMPCPESFMVQFVDEENYIVLCNFRSSEINRIPEDLSIIKTFCLKELGLDEYNLLSISANFMNAHKYLDGGSSEDFTAKTYFETNRI